MRFPYLVVTLHRLRRVNSQVLEQAESVAVGILDITVGADTVEYPRLSHLDAKLRADPRALPVEVTDSGKGRWKVHRVGDIRPWKSDDPDSKRVWWTEGGVHQNLTFPVQPDPISGMHCWHQKVTVTPAAAGDQYGDVVVDTAASMTVYREWMQNTRPAPGPGGLRRPRWFARALRPAEETYVVGDATARRPD